MPSGMQHRHNIIKAGNNAGARQGCLALCFS
nr:MAG TPA: hypothetical protein [Caudoviricetes sp.]